MPALAGVRAGDGRRPPGDEHERLLSDEDLVAVLQVRGRSEQNAAQACPVLAAEVSEKANLTVVLGEKGLAERVVKLV